MFASVRAALPLALLASATFAEPAPPEAGPGIELVDFGIYCATESSGTEPAPGTALGYVDLLPGMPQIVYHQQLVPGRLGSSFGVISRADRDIFGVRIETWKPNATTSDIWFSDLVADSPKMRGFAFDYPEEVLLGLWRLEAWDGDTLLYRVEFEVVPPEQLPGVSSDCNLMS